MYLNNKDIQPFLNNNKTNFYYNNLLFNEKHVMI